MKSSTPNIRIILIDDDEDVHQAVHFVLRAHVDIQLVGEAENGRDGIALCRRHRPDMVLMDVVMPGLNGVETSQLLISEFPDLKIVVLSSYDENEIVQRLLRTGAVGYVIKGMISTNLVHVIRAAHAGTTVLDASITQRMITPQVTENNFNLTERELEVLRELAKGATNDEVATTLYISRSTVKFHINNILHKMQVATRTEAIVLAAKTGII